MIFQNITILNIIFYLNINHISFKLFILFQLFFKNKILIYIFIWFIYLYIYIPPLFTACENGDIEAVTLLLSNKNIDVNLKYIFFKIIYEIRNK